MFLKKFVMKSIKILKKIKDASSLWDNKEGNTQERRGVFLRGNKG